MASSSYAWVRTVVGGIYLLKAGLVALVGLLALLATLGDSESMLGVPAAGAAVFLVCGMCAVIALCYGALGVGLLRGNRIALMLAILFAGLNAVGALGLGQPVGFFIEVAIAAGLLMSRDVRSAYAG